MAKKIKLNDNNKVVEEDKSKKRAIIIALSCVLLLIIGAILVLLLLPKNTEDNTLDDNLGQTYQITINDGEHGQITTASANVKPGEIVSLNTERNLFYDFAKIYYVAENSSKQVEILGNTFEMPFANITIYAEYNEKMVDSKQTDLGQFEYELIGDEIKIKVTPNENTLFLGIVDGKTDDTISFNTMTFDTFTFFLALGNNNLIDLETLSSLCDNYFLDTSFSKPSELDSYINSYLAYLEGMGEEVIQSPEYIYLKALITGCYEFSLPAAEGDRFLLLFENQNEITQSTENNFVANIYPRNNLAVLMSYKGTNEFVEIPANIANNKLIAINSYNSKALTSGTPQNAVFNQNAVGIKLPETINALQFNTFSEIKNLVYVEIPTKTKLVESNIFSYSLNNLVIRFYGEGLVSFNASSLPHSFSQVYAIYPANYEEDYLNSDLANVENLSLISDELFIVDNLNCYLLNEENFSATYLFSLTTNIKELSVPQTLASNEKDFTVNTLASYALSNNLNLTKVTLPNTIQNIGAFAFSGCANLQNINFPSSLNTIGDRAFANTSITGVSLPDSLSSIGQYAFAECKLLATVNLQNTQLKTLPSGIFYNCVNLQTASLPNEISSIGSYAFSDCLLLDLSTLPFQTQTIGERAFYNCKNITISSFPTSLEYLGSSCFENCENITVSVFPKNLYNIGSSCFKNCTGLRGVIITCTRTDVSSKICSNAFANCINLVNFDINGIISEIEQFAFSGCFNLKTFIFRQPNPPFVNQNTFANYNDLENKLTVQLYITDAYFENYKNNDNFLLCYGYGTIAFPVELSKLN